MQNETKLSMDKINSLLNMFKGGNTDLQGLKNMLDDTQREAVNNILSDPEKLRQMLSSPQAKSLMEKFGKKNQGDDGNGSS